MSAIGRFRPIPFLDRDRSLRMAPASQNLHLAGFENVSAESKVSVVVERPANTPLSSAALSEGEFKPAARNIGRSAYGLRITEMGTAEQVQGRTASDFATI